MAKKPDKNSLEIKLLSKAYLYNKRLIIESNEHICKRNYDSLKASLKIVKHIEYCASSLEEKNRFIIKNEVIDGKTGKWYKEYFSAPTYYRIRKQAYEEFLRCL